MTSANIGREFNCNAQRIVEFCRSPILKKLFSEHGELVADSVHYLESNAIRDDAEKAARRLAVVRLIVEMAAWLNACRAVGTGYRAELSAYVQHPIAEHADQDKDALRQLEERAISLSNRIARMDGDFRLSPAPGHMRGDIISQFAVLMHAAGSGCFRA